MTESELIQNVVDAVRLNWFAGPRQQPDGRLQMPCLALEISPIAQKQFDVTSLQLRADVFRIQLCLQIVRFRFRMIRIRRDIGQIERSTSIGRIRFLCVAVAAAWIR